jgi:excisionase family DNA binding protein
MTQRLQLMVDGFRLWLSPKEAQALLSCGRRTLQRYHDGGRIRARRTPGGHRRYWRDDILQMLNPS